MVQTHMKKNIITNTYDLEVGKLYMPPYTDNIEKTSQIYLCMKKDKTTVVVYNIKHNTFYSMRGGDIVYLEELTE